MRPSIVCLCALVFVACARNPNEVVFDGIWQGRDARYPLVTLILTQTGDSLSGSATVALATPPGSIIDARIIGTRMGDSIYVRGPIIPSMSADLRFVVEFGGRITTVGGLLGSINANKQAASTILLLPGGGKL